MRKFVISIITLITFINAYAQEPSRSDSISFEELAAMVDTIVVGNVVPETEIEHRPLCYDSPVECYRASLDSAVAEMRAFASVWESLWIPTPRVKLKPEFYRLFVPLTFYNDIPDKLYEIGTAYREPVSERDSLMACVRGVTRPYSAPEIGNAVRADLWVSRLLMDTYLELPEKIVANSADLDKIAPIKKDKLYKEIEEKSMLKEADKDLAASGGLAGEGKDLVVVRPNFWTKTGNGFAQFTTNNISDNWYKGGESTNSLLSGLTLSANYDDHRYVEFENKLELKLGFITAPSDTAHKYKTNADLIRLNSKLGVKAFENWYYTAAAQVKTQFFANHKTNSNEKISDFMSPLQFDFNLGMDFKKKSDRISLSLLTSPLAYTHIYIKSDDLANPSMFNVKEGHNKVDLFGSKFAGNMTWKIIPSLVWTSKLDMFTTYHKSIVSWENTFDFKFNDYLSTKFFLHGRFDDGVKLDEDNDSYFQWKQMLSFGISYNW